MWGIFYRIMSVPLNNLMSNFSTFSCLDIPKKRKYKIVERNPNKQPPFPPPLLFIEQYIFIGKSLARVPN